MCMIFLKYGCFTEIFFNRTFDPKNGLICLTSVFMLSWKSFWFMQIT